MNFNKAIILGNVVNVPEVKSLPSGMSVATFRVATNRVWYDAQKNKKEESQFHNIVMFGRLADIAQKYLQKGGLVMIEGRIQYRSWEGKDGQKKFFTEIIAESLQLGPRKTAGDASMNAAPPAPHQTKSPDPEVPTVSEDDINIEEEIPF